jgi:hypothetical protein
MAVLDGNFALSYGPGKVYPYTHISNVRYNEQML